LLITNTFVSWSDPTPRSHGADQSLESSMVGHRGVARRDSSLIDLPAHRRLGEVAGCRSRDVGLLGDPDEGVHRAHAPATR
jgi:hypothetical protein